jgi:hypothetical protein
MSVTLDCSEIVVKLSAAASYYSTYYSTLPHHRDGLFRWWSAYRLRSYLTSCRNVLLSGRQTYAGIGMIERKSVSTSSL